MTSAFNLKTMPLITTYHSPLTISPNNDYLKQLDGLRFLAVGLVLYDHWQAEKNTVPLGALGVNLFFVLSGFLITRILLTSKTKQVGQPNGLNSYLKKFYIRRTLRIFPIYYLSILVLWLFQNPAVVDKLTWHFLYATNVYISHYQTWLGVTDHFWSLAVEEQFYIFFPMLIFFLPKRFLVPFFVVEIVFSVGLRLYFFMTGTDWRVSYVSMTTCLDAFGFGSIMAYLFLYKKDTFQKLFTNYFWLVVSLVVLLLELYWEKQVGEGRNVVNDVWERLVASVFFFFLIGGAVVGYKGLMKWLLENPVSNYLGRISYGLYVYHNFIYNFYHTPPSHPVSRLFQALPFIHDNDFLKLSVLFVVAVITASLSWYIIEKPINALKDRLSS